MILVSIHVLAFALLAAMPMPSSSQCPELPGALPADPAIRQARGTACFSISRFHPTSPNSFLTLALGTPDSTVEAEILDAGHRQALKAFEIAAELEPDDADALGEAGLTAAMAGQHDRAVQYYQRAIERRGVNPNVWGYLARSEHALGRHADAVRHWDRAEVESRYRYLDEAGDRPEYDSSLALAPDAHVAPSQLGPAIRLALMLLVPIAVLVFIAWLILSAGSASKPAPAWRIFTAVTVLHIGITEITLVLVVGLSFGAWNGYPSLPMDHLIMAAAGLLSIPLQSPMLPVPPALRFNPPFLLKLLNSMIWAGAVTGVVILWRHRAFIVSRNDC
jgi:tetratricopeptide (TPR) repeat protein